MIAAVRPRAATARRRRIRLRVLLAVLATAGVLAGGWLWLRDSSLVAVRRVSITGVSGADAARISSSLTLAARNMTTLDVRLAQLRTAVAPYPVVKDLRVSTQFPHGLRIVVIEQLPVGALVAGGRAIAASGDGTLLHDVSGASLPAIAVSALPAGSRITDRAALNALSLLAVAPHRLRSRIAQVSTDAPHGLVVQLRSGPSIYFGDEAKLEAKWVAVTEVLADPSSAGASYIDVTDPARPAAGVSQQALSAAGLASPGPSSLAGGSSSAGSTSASAATGSGALSGTSSSAAGSTGQASAVGLPGG